ncbi:TPA: hypothetical protein JZ886_001255 [Escherichia coli]|nr:hypothetical protein [Escherichia coli]
MAEFTKERIIEEMKASTQNTSGMFEISEDTICALMSMLSYPPAPVSVPAAMEIDDDFDSAFEHGKAVGWNAYRAAMLQAEPVSNRDELPLDYLQGHKDGLEWAAQLAEANHPQTGDWLYDDPIDLARAIRKGPDMPTVQGGNSPVIPDGWVMVPVEPTMAMLDEFDSIIDYGAEDSKDAWSRLIAAALQR